MAGDRKTSGVRAAPVRPSRRKMLWLIPAAFLLAGLLLGSWLLTSTRVHQVVPGEVLRSRQLEKDELRDVIETYDLRTVINLRGSPPGEKWLDDHKGVCSEYGVRHETTSFSVEEWPARHEVRRLVRFFDTSEPPILIHCYRGADRSGWAAACINPGCAVWIVTTRIPAR